MKLSAKQAGTLRSIRANAELAEQKGKDKVAADRRAFADHLEQSYRDRPEPAPRATA